MADLTQELKDWIDAATYQQLLSRWHKEPIDSELLMGESGGYYARAMKEKRPD